MLETTRTISFDSCSGSSALDALAVKTELGEFPNTARWKLVNFEGGKTLHVIHAVLQPFLRGTNVARLLQWV